ncbi:hypothetical protein PHYSODRAFT_298212 [Phytophthora sojae]|uniref:Uncharacterized protein n=1 Tax=Phytophthora sojae (strain P6497) TaxID=1094619 RepID=G4Z9V9_PHYSP|nr:hypothetical protein PHYSODRAFT_298212 [Phytophthora sojae]EGZ19812.1 hypothetical protein PHYSODRAFT_298212 [Phytophthora sojae]|eukprot:XP_009522529.1 hypothetical protein PHYSODRAFT_298212 [Phytophthora sojae]
MSLIDALTGGPFADTTPDSVPRTGATDSVQGFRAKVYAKDLTQCAGLIASEVSDELTGLGEDEDHALIVVVPRSSFALPTMLWLRPMEIEWTVPKARVQLSISAETRALELPRACWSSRRKSIAVASGRTGKSCTALAFAYALKPSQWDVIWLHLSSTYGVARCVWLRGGEKVTCTLDMTTLTTQLLLLLGETSNEVTTIVFLDGYDNRENEVMDAGFVCRKWRDDDVIKHRLVFVCSTVRLGGDYRSELTHDIPGTVTITEEAARGVKIPAPDHENSEEGEDEEMFELDETDWQGNKLELEVRDAMRFLLGSWSLEDYRDAAQDETFFNSVKDAFPSFPESGYATATPVERMSLLERRQSVEMKHCIAGGSARLMFGVSVDNAVTFLDDAVSHLRNVGVIESLLAIYRREFGDDETCLLSAYIARQIAVSRGFDILEKIATARRVTPPMDEWLFEAWFLSMLKTEDIRFQQERFSVLRGGVWKRSDVVFFDPSNSSIDIDLEYAICVTPVQWNEAGYDAVFVDMPNRLVRFVQVTRADYHRYDHRYFIEFLGKLIAQQDDQLSDFRRPVTTLAFKENVIQVPSSSSSSVSVAIRTIAGYEFENCEAEVQTLEVDYDVSAHK